MPPERGRHLPHHHRRRPAHGPGAWVRGVACAAAIGGVVVVVALRSPPEQRIVVQSGNEPLCAALDAIAALAFQGLAPPVDATPEDLRAARDVNAQLARLAEQVRSIRSTREGCRG